MELGIIPPYMLEDMKGSRGAIATAAENTLKQQELIHTADVAHKLAYKFDWVPKSEDSKYRVIFDANNNDVSTKLKDDTLPRCTEIRKEGEIPVALQAANEAYDFSGIVWDFYKINFNITSVNNKNIPMNSVVRYGTDFMNAFWSTTYKAMFYGDGTPKALCNFTCCLEVVGHEMTHAVIDNLNPLNYEHESGALNESIADVMGITIKQWHKTETPTDSDWIIGGGLLGSDVTNAKGIRSMEFPGTAYDDPILKGKDRQPDHYGTLKLPLGFEVDRGGVHILSGIPNRAFVLFTKALFKEDDKTRTWDIPAQLWFKTLRCRDKIGPNATFKEFAVVTVEIAKEFGPNVSKHVLNAWQVVGVL